MKATDSKDGQGEASLTRLVSLLATKGPMRAGELGFELWGTRADRCHCENVQATMFVRTATRLLYRAERLGLVRWREHGRSRIWQANARDQRPGTPKWSSEKESDKPGSLE
jgi:hypothetical protein